MSLPNFSLSDKVTIITGGSRGIGKSIALAFAEAGADIVVCSRNLDGKLELVAEEIRGRGRRSLAVATDVTQKAAVDSLVQRTMEKFGTIDILVNNAGTIIRKSLVEHSEGDWDRVMDTNLKSAFLCSLAVSQIMMNQKSGNIINIASLRSFVAVLERPSYCVSKAGVVMLTRVMALEFAKYNIRVNAIAPGWVSTPMTEHYDLKVREEINATIPMGRWATADEIANIALLFASDVSSYVTGHTLLVDGGISLRLNL